MKTLAALAIVVVLAVWLARRPAMIEPLPNAADGAGGAETVQPEMIGNDGCPPGQIMYYGAADQYPFCTIPGAPSAVGGDNASEKPNETWPVAPVDGDVWQTTRGVFCHVNGDTIGPTTAAACGASWQAAYFPASGGPPVISDVMHGHGWTNGSPPWRPAETYVDRRNQ